jgi:hypothetical protein
MGDPVDPVRAVLAAHASADAIAWLDARGAQLQQRDAGARSAFFVAYAGAQRRFGRVQPALTADERVQLHAAGIVEPASFALSDLSRALLLRGVCAALPPGEHVALVTDVLRKGDNGERIALLRALPLLPDPARFTELAIDACRTHVLDVFAAIACDNPFPARYFPEPSFNQLVIKTLFVELPLGRVHGWIGRANPELVRMAADYEAERRAAGRPVPADIALIRAQAQNQENPS